MQKVLSFIYFLFLIIINDPMFDIIFENITRSMNIVD